MKTGEGIGDATKDVKHIRSLALIDKRAVKVSDQTKNLPYSTIGLWHESSLRSAIWSNVHVFQSLKVMK